MPSTWKRSSANFGKLPGALERAPVDQERHVRLAVAARGVEVEHERDQRPLERGTGTPEHGETGARDRGGALEVEDAERRPEIPVRLDLEVEARQLAPGALDAVRALVGADRHRDVRQVGHRRARARSPRRRGAPPPARRRRCARRGRPARPAGARPRPGCRTANSRPTSLEPRLRSAFIASSSACVSRHRPSTASSSLKGASERRTASAARTRSGSLRHSSRASMTTLRSGHCWLAATASQPRPDSFSDRP